MHLDEIAESLSSNQPTSAEVSPFSSSLSEHHNCRGKAIKLCSSLIIFSVMLRVLGVVPVKFMHN